ncbi:MAG: Rieske 2Fe-2S domain-containing protein [Myxococcales bacterium]|nr:Rieske 2Fe-2S domain-containing protein [Myxococcales bacterium]
MSELATGQVKDVSYPDGDSAGFLVRLGRVAEHGVGPDRDIVGFLRACPHMGCRIETVDVAKAICGPCGCHRSKFDLSADGKLLLGRATQNLVRIKLAVSRDKILATGLVGLRYGHLMEAP